MKFITKIVKKYGLILALLRRNGGIGLSYEEIVEKYKELLLKSTNRRHTTAAQSDPLLGKIELRSDFNKDRDKILYSKAFRRLQSKTQVFHSNVSDHFRTRLTHTLEVSQLSRTIALELNLFTDLAEAIALGHDVGHTPYGHAGETALNRILRWKNKEISSCIKDILANEDYKELESNLGKYSFKHNLHSVKILDYLERKSPKYIGYNLTNLTKEGIIKHTSVGYKENGKLYFRDWGGIDIKEVNIHIDENGLVLDGTYCTFLESQIVNLCDEIAQATHDLEDGFRTNRLNFDEVFRYIEENFLAIFTDETPQNIREYNKTNEDKNEVMDFIIACLINHIVHDCIQTSKRNIVDNWSEAILFPPATISLSKKYKSGVEGLQDLLTNRLILSEAINQMDVKAEKFITELFLIFYKYPLLLPDSVLDYYVSISGNGRLRSASKDNKEVILYDHQKDYRYYIVVIDYIAGMTDRFIEKTYEKFVLPGAI